MPFLDIVQFIKTVKLSLLNSIQMLTQFVFSGMIELNQVRQQTVAHLRLQSTNIYLCRSWCCAGLQQMFKYSEKT